MLGMTLTDYFYMNIQTYLLVVIRFSYPKTFEVRFVDNTISFKTFYH